MAKNAGLMRLTMDCQIIRREDLSCLALDKWLGPEPLATTFPALYSHCLRPHSSIHHTLSEGVEILLHPRLTHQAQDKLLLLRRLLSSVQLTDYPDCRLLNLPSSPPIHQLRHLRALHSEAPVLLGPKLIWECRLPGKVKFFGWLVHFDRMNSRANLFWKNIKPLEECFCPACDGVLETGDHIFTACPRARKVWDALHCCVSAGLQRLPWLIGQEIDLPATVRMDVTLTVLWHIWKARNTLIFNKENNTAASIIRDVARDLGSWACRFRRAKSHIAAWQTYVQERLPHAAAV
ncbi:unnamed protein product [Miscanthus lutarioriparius]|uniref:Reverse transcriptase zinc-binding domain-containing protein n=1 Tax=Miscanthus lutarioriparius TaxID=422564 RepID=A0A811NNU4_9POAL|nr:unnamed protein product [Miscanthus lutarioriparius]